MGTRTKYSLQRWLTLLLYPAALFSLWACSQEDPSLPIPESESVEVLNPAMRSPQEAIEIAEKAWQDFYGNDPTVSRSSSFSLIDYTRPVEVVRNHNSRGVTGADTLLYVVNFVDDSGFAIIAAPRNNREKLLAITSSGHYYPESMPEEETNPGFELWLNSTLEFIPDTLPTPIPLPGIAPGDERLQVKEWEDTISKSQVGPQLLLTWGQGGGLPKNINTRPEGYYFSNGHAGCATIAMAQVCAFYKSPQSMLSTPLQDATMVYFDWDRMASHMRLVGSKSTCLYEDSEVHEMVATCCRVIANWTFAEEKTNSTSTSRSNVLPILRRLLPDRTIEGWNDLKFLAKPQTGGMFLVCGDGDDAGHMWVADGGKTLIVEHKLATRKNSIEQWNIVSTERYVQDYLHYNWGWYGWYDGWFYNGMSVVYYDVIGAVHQYKNLKYARIS